MVTSILLFFIASLIHRYKSVWSEQKAWKTLHGISAMDLFRGGDEQAVVVSPDSSGKRRATAADLMEDKLADCTDDDVAVAGTGAGPSPGLDGKGYFYHRVSALNGDDEIHEHEDQDLRVNEVVQFSGAIGEVTETAHAGQGKQPITTITGPSDGQLYDCTEDVPLSGADGGPSPKEYTPQVEQQVRIEVQPPMDENDVVIGEKQAKSTRKKFWRFAQPDMDLLEAEYDATSFCRAILMKWQAQSPKGRFIQKETATGKYRLMNDSESLSYIVQRLKFKNPKVLPVARINPLAMFRGPRPPRHHNRPYFWK